VADEAPEPEGPESVESPLESAEDEAKRRFREALERKRDGGKGQKAAGEKGASKINEAHGPARSQRSFRRKSG